MPKLIANWRCGHDYGADIILDGDDLAEEFASEPLSEIDEMPSPLSYEAFNRMLSELAE